MPSGVPKGENCQVDMDSKAGDLFTAEDAHPTGTGGTGILAKYEFKCVCLSQIYHTIELTCASASVIPATNVYKLNEPPSDNINFAHVITPLNVSGS